MKKFRILLAAAVFAAVCACTEKATETEERFSFSGPGEINAPFKEYTATVSFRTNCAWKLEVPAEASDWISVNPASGDAASQVSMKRVAVRILANDGDGRRSAELVLTAGSKHRRTITVNQSSKSDLKSVSETSISDDMFFSSVPAATSTAVQQGFEFTSDMSTMYFSQLNSSYKNRLSRTPRVAITTSTTLAAEKMDLYYFSHGNNIHLEEASDGNAYIWLANYGTRDSENKYGSPQILSRVKFVPGTVLRNTETTDNYWFNTKTLHASFDVENDRLAILGESYTMKIYRLSEVLAAPVRTITLPYSITCGGANSPDPEYVGQPEVVVHDCSGLTPVSTFSYNYKSNGRGWQTFCIHDGKVYFFLFYSNKTNDMYYQSVIDIFNFKGQPVKTDIKQPFADNLDDLIRYGLTDADTKYMENEGILIRGGVLYLLYTAKNKDGFRRPVIFQLNPDSLLY